MVTRRTFNREFKLEAVRLVRERGVAVTQAARDLDVHENVLRKWVREQKSDPQHAFPGQGQMKPEQADRIARQPRPPGNLPHRLPIAEMHRLILPTMFMVIT